MTNTGKICVIFDLTQSSVNCTNNKSKHIAVNVHCDCYWPTPDSLSCDFSIHQTNNTQLAATYLQAFNGLSCVFLTYILCSLNQTWFVTFWIRRHQCLS